MERSKYHAMAAVVVGLCVSSMIFAQNRASTIPVSDRYLISAKPGGVNYLSGAVTIVRASGTSGVLLNRDRVEIGDRVTTGTDGRAEILLNPGSFIRLGRNSSFEFGSTDLENLQIRLDSGSAMFEIFATDEFRVSVSTPKGDVALVDSGIYRIDVATDGSALLSVTKGKAEVGDGKPTVVKGGRTGTVGTNMVAVAKFDKDKRDDLGEWSRSRSKELAQVTSSFHSPNLNLSLMNGFNSRSWGLYDSFGLWIFNAQFGGYCFMPFGGGWRSPYGWWYRNGIYWNNIPTWYNAPVGVAPAAKVSSRTPRVSNGGGSDTPTKVSSRERGRNEIEPPPFTKIGRGGGDVGFGSEGLKSSGSDYSTGRSSFPSSSPSYSAPAPSAPVKVSSRGN